MITESITSPGRLILASTSPRRKYLLENAGIAFTVMTRNVDETPRSGEAPHAYVARMAAAKAAAVAADHPDAWVVGADTIGEIGGAILGKPGSRQGAFDMLRTLSGTVHRVMTAFSLVCRERNTHIDEVVSTDVIFKQLSDQEIEWYIGTGEPFDKAGAYAIQGRGSFLVKRINGSYTNVVGLPVCELVEILIREQVIDMAARKPVF
ncbi:MAG: septum formation inhibitor Maf [Deltaproteobacteria bacterium]|nr:MAG: septum formation inhibitor Maf [Deltaproteobacteria bacterium]